MTDRIILEAAPIPTAGYLAPSDRGASGARENFDLGLVEVLGKDIAS